MITERGIRIACQDRGELARRARVSDIHIAKTGAILPTFPLRKATDAELDQLIATRETPHHLIVQFVQVPKDLGLRLHEVQTVYSENQDRYPNLEYTIFIGEVPAVFEPIPTTRGGMKTAAISKNGTPAGLHLDGWRFPKKTENLTQEKIVTNLGPYARRAGFIFNTNAEVIAASHNGAMPSEEQSRAYVEKHVDTLKAVWVELDEPGASGDTETYYSAYKFSVRYPFHDGLNDEEGDSAVCALVFNGMVPLYPSSL